MAVAPSILNIHTPSTSFAIVHSLTQNSLQDLYDTLSRKAHTSYHGARVGPGWLKYEFNDSIWNLDDESDYTIFVWRQQQTPMSITSVPSGSSYASSHLAPPSISSAGQQLPSQAQPPPQTPTLHLHNPTQPLPTASEYQNPSYYLFIRARARSPGGISPSPSIRTKRSTKSKRITINGDVASLTEDGVPKHKKEFDRFHSENGVRTVMGSIGPVQNVRMLLKNGHRHVYISRKFAIKHGFIPKNATLGYYGYSGLVNIGNWPITLTPSPKDSSHLDAPPQPPASKKTNGIPQATTVTVAVYLSEEPHFDVVLGRSFFEKRKIKLNPMDPTDIVCMDTGEKIECELVILKDGRGEIVTVT